MFFFFSCVRSETGAAAAERERECGLTLPSIHAPLSLRETHQRATPEQKIKFENRKQEKVDITPHQLRPVLGEKGGGAAREKKKPCAEPPSLSQKHPGQHSNARLSVPFAPEAAPLRQAGLAARRLAQRRRAGRAGDDRLGVGENSRDLEAALALDVHEVRVGGLHQALELVAAGLEGGGRVQEVDVVGERLCVWLRVDGGREADEGRVLRRRERCVEEAPARGN